MIPTAIAIGLVSIGQSIAVRTGADRLWVGVLSGSLVGGLAAATLPAGLAVGTVAAAVGMGATVRVLVTASGPTAADERAVPPANKI